MFTDKYITVLLWLLLISFSPAFSQDFDDLYSDETEKKEDSVSLSDKVYFGGDFSLSFGSSFYFSIAPEVGYKIFPWLHAGLGAYYMHASSNLYNYSISVYGGRTYLRPFVFKKLFLQAEYELLNVPRWDSTYGYTGNRVMVPGALGGIGYMQKSGGRFGFYIALLYNFTISEQTPYSNPVIRTGFVF